MSTMSVSEAYVIMGYIITPGCKMSKLELLGWCRRLAITAGEVWTLVAFPGDRTDAGYIDVGVKHDLDPVR